MTLEDIQVIVTEQIDPILALHNGRCQLISLEENILTISLEGGCVGCPSSKITLYNGIIPILQEHFPSLEEVVLEI